MLIPVCKYVFVQTNMQSTSAPAPLPVMVDVRVSVYIVTPAIQPELVPTASTGAEDKNRVLTVSNSTQPSFTESAGAVWGCGRSRR